MAPALSAITDSVHFAHTDLVNWTLVADDTGVILIDAGFPGSRDDVLASLRHLGFGIDDLRAILLTHAHIDHFGSAIWFAKTHGTPVYCHADEVGHAKREYLEQASPVDVATHAWQPRWLKWSVAISRKGAFTRDGIPTAQALTEDVAAGLPGAPMAIPSPGHTGGHCSFVVDGVLVSGDALVTGHPVATRSGPQLLHKVFNHDQDGCVRSLAALAMLETDVLRARSWPGVARPYPRSRSTGHAALGERFIAQQEDRGQAQPAAHHECRHQNLVVEIGVVGCFPPTADQRTQHESGRQRQAGGGKEQPPYGRLRNLHPTTPPAALCDSLDQAYRQRWSRRVWPAYSVRNAPRSCSNGTTWSTNSSRPCGVRCGTRMKPSQASA